MGNTISQKIDAYAKANLKALKQEEAKTGRKMTKFDIAQYMLQHGKLNKNEYANWMNTSEGFNAQAMTQQQKTALRQGSVFGFAGYGGGQESYLDSMTSFEQKTPIEKFNEVYSPRVKLNETVAERKKKAAEIQKHLQEQRVAKQVLHPNEALKEQKLMDEINSKKVSEEDKDKTAMELSKEIDNKNKSQQAVNDFKQTVKNSMNSKINSIEQKLKEALIQQEIEIIVKDFDTKEVIFPRLESHLPSDLQTVSDMLHEKLDELHNKKTKAKNTDEQKKIQEEINDLTDVASTCLSYIDKITFGKNAGLDIQRAVSISKLIINVAKQYPDLKIPEKIEYYEEDICHFLSAKDKQINPKASIGFLFNSGE